MSEAKHTPGPWVVCVHENHTTVEGPAWTVAMEVSNEDAHPIAAAPEMLEALIAACGALVSLDARMKACGGSVSATEAYDSFYQANLADALQEGRAAIAKATGETK